MKEYFRRYFNSKLLLRVVTWKKKFIVKQMQSFLHFKVGEINLKLFFCVLFRCWYIFRYIFILSQSWAVNVNFPSNNFGEHSTVCEWFIGVCVEPTWNNNLTFFHLDFYHEARNLLTSPLRVLTGSSIVW